MTRTEATARVIEIMREFIRVHDADIGKDAMFEYAEMANDAKEALAAHDDSTPDSEGGWLKRIAEILNLDGKGHARHNLDGAYIDLEREGTNKVCLKTLRRVRSQLREIEVVLEDALPAPPTQEPTP